MNIKKFLIGHWGGKVHDFITWDRGHTSWIDLSGFVSSRPEVQPSTRRLILKEVVDLAALLPNYTLYTPNGKDEWIWKESVFGNFTVKSTYHFLEENNEKNVLWKAI